MPPTRATQPWPDVARCRKPASARHSVLLSTRCPSTLEAAIAPNSVHGIVADSAAQVGAIADDAAPGAPAQAGRPCRRRRAASLRPACGRCRRSRCPTVESNRNRRPPMRLLTSNEVGVVPSSSRSPVARGPLHEPADPLVGLRVGQRRQRDGRPERLAGGNPVGFRVGGFRLQPEPCPSVRRSRTRRSARPAGRRRS